MGTLKKLPFEFDIHIKQGTWLLYGFRKVIQGVICRYAELIAHFLIKILLFPSLCIEVLKCYLLSFVTVYNDFGMKVYCVMNLIGLLL